jgi:thioesterase domain-containing protein
MPEHDPLPADTSFNEDAKQFFGWLSGLTRYRGAGAPLTTKDRTATISRMVPFQPRQPLSEAVQLQQDEREEAAARRAERAQLKEQRDTARGLWLERQEVARKAWFDKHTVKPGGRFEGALDEEATDYLLKLQRWNNQEKNIGDASLHGTPLDVAL